MINSFFFASLSLPPIQDKQNSFINASGQSFQQQREGIKKKGKQSKKEKKKMDKMFKKQQRKKGAVHTESWS